MHLREAPRRRPGSSEVRARTRRSRALREGDGRRRGRRPSPLHESQLRIYLRPGPSAPRGAVAQPRMWGQRVAATRGADRRIVEPRVLQTSLAGRPSPPSIRPFERRDSEESAGLLFLLSPAAVQTADSLVHRQVSEPERALRRSWVAIEGGHLVGFATAYFQWFGGEAGKGRIWVGVRAESRRRGVGSALWSTAVAHLGGARKHTVEVDDDPAGLAFVEHRGFTQYDAEVISRLDPADCGLESKPHEGFRVVSLREVHECAGELFEFYGKAGGIPPGDLQNRVTLEEWRRAILANPILDLDASAVVLDREQQIVSLSWLLVDPVRRRAENEWTAMLPRLRGRGLARLAKLASIRSAAERQITEIVTGTDPDNLPMRELNRRLGYCELFVRRDFERAPGIEDAGQRTLSRP